MSKFTADKRTTLEKFGQISHNKLSVFRHSSPSSLQLRQTAEKNTSFMPHIRKELIYNFKGRLIVCVYILTLAFKYKKLISFSKL